MWLKLYQLRCHWRAFMVLGFVLFTIIACTVRLTQPRLVVVDMMRAIHVPSQMLARSTMPEALQVKLMARFSTLLPEVIKAYGQDHHVTVVGASVFVSQGQVDITNTIIQQTLSRLKHDA